MSLYADPKALAVATRRGAADTDLGDDETGADAFRALDGDALTIRVGPVTTTTAADRRFAPVAGVYRVLAGLARPAERAR